MTEQRKKLHEIYRKGVARGFITSSYPRWRKDVVKRINILFRKNYIFISDKKLYEYLKDEVKTIIIGG